MMPIKNEQFRTIKKTWPYKDFYSIYKVILYLIYLCPCQCLGQFMSYLYDIFYIFHKRNYVYLTFHCGRNETNFFFRGSPRWTALRIKTNLLVYACADVSFHMISFRVVFTWYFITRNEILFLSEWRQWNNTRSKFHFGLYHVNSYKKLTRHRNENISLCPKRNLM